MVSYQIGSRLVDSAAAGRNALATLCLVVVTLIVLGPGSAVAAATGNEEAVRRCQELMPAFVKAPMGVAISLQDQGPNQPFGVRLDWRASASNDTAGQPLTKDGWIICWFLCRGLR